MNNLVAASPITLAPDPSFWAKVPAVPVAVQDGFGEGEAVLDQKIWRGLVARGGKQVFAWVVGNALVATAMTDARRHGQSLESDAGGRALVIGADSRSLYAVEASGAAHCLGVLPESEGKLGVAGWLPDGGVVAAVGDGLCVYGPASEPGGPLRPRLRFESPRRNLAGIRSLPSPDPHYRIFAGFAFDTGFIAAIGPDEQVRLLADFDGLDLGDIRICLDETGMRTALPKSASVSTSGGLTRVEGLAEALARFDALPGIPTQAPPSLTAGTDPTLAPGTGAAIVSEPVVPTDAAVPPALARLPRRTAALIKMLRSAPARSEPDPRILGLIRQAMPIDLRAYVHAWACHAPNNPAVYEFWMGPPRVEDRGWIREHAGECLAIGSFASGEPIVARRASGSEAEIVMIDEEGQPYRYRGFEEFLADLQMRAPEGQTELDRWL